MRFFLLLIVIFFGNFIVFAQEEPSEKLNEITLSSPRLDVPFKEGSFSVQIITADELNDAISHSLAELLQQINGVDVRRRGTDGMQADLYIRGGSFDQTLLLIDGFKVENPQTGHHTLNMVIPLETIERIEIVKGPAARIYGQNTFTGAVNIVTKKQGKSRVKGLAGYGSYNRKAFEITGELGNEKGFHQVHYSRMVSDGYRYNTDFKNQNLFWKSKFNTPKAPVTVLATFSERKFGANGFYASPDYKDQYEETQASLVGISSQIHKNDLKITPRLYWTRGQDMYEFVRGKPEIYRNLHITNKVGASADFSLSSSLGKTGFGFDLARASIASNNLGNHNRIMLTGFLEHRFMFFDERFDLTPGVAVMYFSDFRFHAFPGVDAGFQIDKYFRLYGNFGYTYRIPTYTDLYYVSPTTIGNPDLQPERAISGELGLKYQKRYLLADLTLFTRRSNNLIDYVKDNEDDRWQAENIQRLNTRGIETSLRYTFFQNQLKQYVKGGYTFLDEDLQQIGFNFSRYSINSLRHQVTAGYGSSFWKYMHELIAYRYVMRQDGSAYHLVDLSITASYRGASLQFLVNNLFDTEYTETNLVPMPGRNFMLNLSYTFE